MKKPATGIVILNVFICILITIPILLVFFFGQVRYYISNNGIEKIVDSMIDSSEMDLLVEDADIRELLYYGDIDLDDMSDEFIEETNQISKDITGQMIRYVLTGEGEVIDVDQLMDYYEEYADEIEDITGEKINDRYLNTLRNEIEDMVDEIEDEYEDEISESEEYIIIKSFFSINNVIVSSAIVVVGLAVIFVTFNKRVDKSLKYTGVTFLVSSILMALLQSITLLIKYVAQEDDDTRFLADLLGMFIKNSLIIAGIVFISSILLIVLSGVIRKKFKEKYGADFEPGTMPASNQYFGNPAYTQAPNQNFNNQYQNGNVNQYNNNPYGDPYGNANQYGTGYVDPYNNGGNNNNNMQN